VTRCLCELDSLPFSQVAAILRRCCTSLSACGADTIQRFVEVCSRAQGGQEALKQAYIALFSEATHFDQIVAAISSLTALPLTTPGIEA
jgi:hypothetical protein